jgi:L-seryl-tRNA(Ser) seleniumtransferase
MRLRDLPSVDELTRGVDDPLAVDAARTVLAEARETIAAGGSPGDLAASLRAELHALRAPRLRRVLNATGVIVHTNLGRAPLAAEALERVVEAARGYSNLEYELEEGRRGSRQEHVADALRRLTGAEAALVVNNNAAAVLLALAALAEGREVVVSRGELIEIGDGFRIPDVLARSGARLREVGTTNRTRALDYERAVGPETAALLRVHQSNFRVVGFTEQPTVAELAAVARRHGVPLVDDLGSGVLVALEGEPSARESLAAGADLVCFSGDKLLGGPQAGIVVGRRAIVARLKKNPWNRALRIDKFTIAALEATLHAYESGTAQQTIPTLRALTEPVAAVRQRARRVVGRLAPDIRRRLAPQVMEDHAEVGGGALPTVELPTAGIAIGETPAAARALDVALRTGDPPVIGRLRDDRLFLDCRTVLPAQLAALVSALTHAAQHIADTASASTDP